jgi:hypothetical protein
LQAALPAVEEPCRHNSAANTSRLSTFKCRQAAAV